VESTEEKGAPPQNGSAGNISHIPVFNASYIPFELKQTSSWTTWLLVEQADGKKAKKVPWIPGSDKNASNNDPATWGEFELARADVESGRRDGLNFAFGKGCGEIVGIDLDDVWDPVTKQFTGPLAEEAKTIIERFKNAGAYIEFSPSVTGFRIFFRANATRLGLGYKGQGTGKFHGIELGDASTIRFMSVTGNVVNLVYTLPDCTEDYRWIIETYMPKLEPATVSTGANSWETDWDCPNANIDDDELWEQMFRQKKKGPGGLGGEDIRALYEGRPEDVRLPNGALRYRRTGRDGRDEVDRSAAELALANVLAFRTGRDPDRMERMMRQTGMAREKWDTHRTYLRDFTIRKACRGCKQTYQGRAGASTTEHEAENDLDDSKDATVQRLNDDGVAMIHTDSGIMFCIQKPNGDVLYRKKGDMQEIYANDLIPVPRGKAIALVSAFDVWRESKNRKEFKGGVVFAPEGAPSECLNLYRGPAIDPKKASGTCVLFWQLVLNAICAGSQDHYRYVRKWLAHMVQHPEELPGVALVLRSGQGTGKGAFTEYVGGIWGKRHAAFLNSSDRVFQRFNSILEAKIFVSCNEAVWGGNPAQAGKFKALITDEIELIERKGLETIAIRSSKRFVFSSNEDLPVPLDQDDRRVVLLNVATIYQGNHDFFTNLRIERDNGGVEALYNELLAEDLNGFNVRKLPDQPTGWDVKIECANTADQWIYEMLSEAMRPSSCSTNEVVWGEEFSEMIVKTKFKEAYLEWCKTRHKNHPVSIRKLKERLKLLIGCEFDKQRVEDMKKEGSKHIVILPGLSAARACFAQTYKGVTW
jgi:hypothetical protein